MRIVHLTHGRANPESHNAISSVVYNMNKYEKLEGIQSEIWAIVDGTKKHYSYTRDKYVTVECFPRVRLPFIKNEIIEKLIDNKDSIDLVHFHLIFNIDKNIIANSLKKYGVPFIITSHGTYSKPHASTGKRLIAKYLYEKQYLNLAKEIHTLTREEGTGLQQYGYNGKSFVAYNGINISELKKERNSNFFADRDYNNKIKFIWLGVLRDDKNIKSLIEAVAYLDNEVKKQIVIIIVGPDWKGNLSKYKQLAIDLHCSENFDFLGPLYNQDKFDALESSDIYVMPSFSEGFSLAMIEAMSCAKPLLITPGCGLNYISNRTFSVNCEPYSQDLTRGITEILIKKDDWIQMGIESKLIVEEKLSWDKVTKVMIKNYERIINE